MATKKDRCFDGRCLANAQVIVRNGDVVRRACLEHARPYLPTAKAITIIDAAIAAEVTAR